MVPQQIIGEFIHQSIGFIKKLWFYLYFDIKWSKNEGTRLGMGRGDQQLGCQPGAFLAGAFFFQKQHVPFLKRRLLNVFWLIMGPTRGLRSVRALHPGVASLPGSVTQVSNI